MRMALCVPHPVSEGDAFTSRSARTAPRHKIDLDTSH